MEATDPNSSSVYDTHPLDLQDATHIRLIEPIYYQTYSSDNPPELRMQSVSYRVHVFSLEDAPLFTALSYVWGPPEATKTICLDGKLVQVMKNLWDFLSYYEPQEPSKYLWIDALCINQDSVKERNHQVGIMGQIYRRAFMVIAWLGLGYDEALSLISNASNNMTAELRPSTDSTRRSQEMKRVIAAWPSLGSSFRTISQSDYWSRLWIVQEFVVNSRSRIGSGKVLLDIDAFFQRLGGAGVDTHFTLTALDILYFYPAYRVISARRSYVVNDFSFNKGRASCDLIRTFTDFKCADVRDHVFGLVGLFPEDELRAHPIVVDYSQPVTTLFFKMLERRKQQVSDWESADDIEAVVGFFADDLRDALRLPLDFGLDDGVSSWRAYVKSWRARRTDQETGQETDSELNS